MKLNYSEIIPSKNCILSKILETKAASNPKHEFILTDDRNYTFLGVQAF